MPQIWSYLWPSSEWYARSVQSNSIPARNGGYAVELCFDCLLGWTLPFEWGGDNWGGLCGN